MPTTKLLCHFNGVDGATSVSDDVGGVSWTLTTFSTPSAQLDTGRPKFGSAALELASGDPYATFTGVSVTGSGNFTVEGWVQHDIDGTGPSFQINNSGAALRVEIAFTRGAGPGTVTLNVWNSSGTLIINTDGAPATWNLDTYYHWAVVRDASSGYWDLFFNGARLLHISAGGTSDLTNGAIYAGSETGAWIDEVRITDGIEYGGATYTVPTGEFSLPVAPVSAFSANVTTGFAPQSITFTDASTNTPTSWLWERKTTGSYATFSTSQNPVVSWDEGIYDVKLTATNAAGSDAEEKLDYIAIAAVFAPAADTVTTSETAALTTEILLAASDTVTTSDSADLLTGSEFTLSADTVTTTDSAALTTAILLEASDTVTTSDSATLTVPATVVLVPPSGGAHAQDDLNVGGVNKPAIPPTTDLPLALIRVLDPMKQNIEIITGRRGGRIEALADGATLEEVLTKVNQIVARLMQ